MVKIRSRSRKEEFEFIVGTKTPGFSPGSSVLSVTTCEIIILFWTRVEISKDQTIADFAEYISPGKVRSYELLGAMNDFAEPSS